MHTWNTVALHSRSRTQCTPLTCRQPWLDLSIHRTRGTLSSHSKMLLGHRLRPVEQDSFILDNTTLMVWVI